MAMLNGDNFYYINRSYFSIILFFENYRFINQIKYTFLLYRNNYEEYVF